MAYYNLNEVLKEKEEAEKKRKQDNGEVRLDDVTRVKVLSPGRQVVKRFSRNHLAIFGLVTLIVMFVFCFIGPLFYPYGQTEVFYEYDILNTDYALASQNSTYTGFTVDESVELERNVISSMNTNIKAMEAEGLTTMNVLGEEGALYSIEKLGDGVYTLSLHDATLVCTVGVTTVDVGVYDGITQSMEYNVEDLGSDFLSAASSGISGVSGEFNYGGSTYSFERIAGRRYQITVVNEGLTYAGANLGESFETALEAALDSGEEIFFVAEETEEGAEGAEAAEEVEVTEVEGDEYTVHAESDGNSYVYSISGQHLGMVFSIYSIDTYETGLSVSNEFRCNALLAAYDSGSFTADGASYTVEPTEEGLLVRDASGNEYAEFTDFVIRRYDGTDTMSYALKSDIRDAIIGMQESGSSTTTVVSQIPQQTAEGGYETDESGNIIENDTELTITRRSTGEYIINCDQITYLVDIYADPSSEHILGTDGDGFDVFSRIMYGGRISLMVGFVVVILELILGVIMGGLAGYYGGWVDNLIMRLVDIFYCLPMMPIMIILGALMDAMRMDTYIRLMIMMASLGIMGWAGIARMVRGQILSLREQEFMVATEATGIRVKDRIFRHLIPNVMPQLIVIATLNIGSVIITESTLSFLGLGVKHPLATWGTIINSVSSATAMAEYPFIWIPVGLLICLTVIAFNFVGDGLRDAYDPKSKR